MINPKNLFISKPGIRELNERERDILRTVIHLYILNASPVGSRNLSKYLEKDMKLSPATIRNVMFDLEEMELISQPHTSAGRIPTDKGYRFYVENLMLNDHLTEKEVITVKENLTIENSDIILKEASKVLGMLSRYLGLVEIPHLIDFAVQKVELISLSSTRLLVVIALDSNIVRTVTLEAEFEIENSNLEPVRQLINERISGKQLRFIRENFNDLISDFTTDDSPLIRLFVNSVDKLFENQKTIDRIHIAGTQNLLSYPEFDDPGRVRGVIELIENEDIIIHLLDQYESGDKDIKVLIGSEMQNELLDDYSLIVSHYQFGSATGSIGLIGPKRMNYSKMTSLVQYVSLLLTKKNN